MTNIHTLNDMADEVRLLGLEVQKLELDNRITQLKAESPLNDTDRLGAVIISQLEAELSAREQDYEVFRKVVDIVKNWDEESGRAFPTMYELCDLLVDYTDAPDLPIREDDPSIEGEHGVTLKVGFLELP